LLNCKKLRQTRPLHADRIKERPSNGCGTQVVENVVNVMLHGGGLHLQFGGKRAGQVGMAAGTIRITAIPAERVMTNGRPGSELDVGLRCGSRTLIISALTDLCDINPIGPWVSDRNFERVIPMSGFGAKVSKPHEVSESNSSGMPEEFREAQRKRFNRRLADYAGLKNFGVNLIRVAPGGQSSARHAHTKQDEFVYVLEGEFVLVTDSDGQTVGRGTCIGFPAGTGSSILRFENSPESQHLSGLILLTYLHGESHHPPADCGH
jgi:uncharacterized cupin superfamily protein